MTKTDVQLKRDINQELACDPMVNAARIAVSVDQGAVTLLGNVDTYWERWAAEEAIKRVAGVRTVAQDLTVNVLEHHKRNDSDIAAAVQTALQWNVTVPATVTAEVRNGSVTLSGQVTWNYQRDAAAQAIRAMKGVVGVTNLISLEKLNVPAEQVKAKLEAALQRRATGEANSIHVDTSGGKVTLSGKAASWRSMADAEDAAWATPGVTLIVDRVQIESLSADPRPLASSHWDALAGTELAEPGAMDPSYFERVLVLAMLSQEEENALAHRWCKLGDATARNSLIQAHLRLVPPIARRYHCPGASLSELIAEGNFGLLRASGKFEPQRGYRFATYARYWIRACVSECAIRNSGAAMSMPRTLRKVRREHARATNLVGDGTEVRRIIAERLQLNPGTVDDLVGLLHRRQVSFESLRSEWHTDEPLYASEDSPEQAMVSKIERQRLGEAVRAALVTLNARERRIVDRRLMADAEAVLTLQELGREFGVSRERVRQLEANIKRKLGTHFRALSNAEARAPEVAA